MKLRYRCTNKPWHITHEIETDERREDIGKSIKCLFCGAVMSLEIIEDKIGDLKREFARMVQNPPEFNPHTREGRALAAEWGASLRDIEIELKALGVDL